jgi:hypothetical protein
MRLILAWIGALAVASPMAAQNLTARELFYGQGPMQQHAQQAAPRKKAPSVTAPSVTKAANSQHVSSEAQPASQGNQEQSERHATPDQVQYVNASLTPLGLKYIILKRDPNGESSQVSLDSTFASGDSIKLLIESNSPGYLYVVTQGASHRWKPMFFSGNGDPKDNHVEPGGQYSIPRGDNQWFTFVAPAGAEKLFLVLSRQPESDLEQLIHSLGKPAPDKPAPDKPAPDKPAARSDPNVMMAANLGSVQDNVVQRLRTTYSRDLIIEAIDDTKKPAAKQSARPPETAVYVVNPKGGADARLVADIELRHE